MFSLHTPADLARTLNSFPPLLFRWQMELPVPQTAPQSVSRGAASMLAVTGLLAPKRSLTSAWCAAAMVQAAPSNRAPSKNSGPFTISVVPSHPVPSPPPPPFSRLLFLELNAFLVTQHFLESKWETVEQTVTMQCSTC